MKLNEKLVIYKELGKLKATYEDNYYTNIQNAKRIIDLSEFNTFDEVTAYYAKYYPDTKLINKTGD